MEPGSRWVPGEGSRAQPWWAEHAAFMDELVARDLIELAGPLADGGGALVVVRGESVDEVRDRFASDPWSVHDVCPVTDVRKWTIFLDGRSGVTPEGS
jgi:uncharacterized protein YciI